MLSPSSCSSRFCQFVCCILWNVHIYRCFHSSTIFRWVFTSFAFRLIDETAEIWITQKTLLTPLELCCHPFVTFAFKMISAFRRLINMLHILLPILSTLLLSTRCEPYLNEDCERVRRPIDQLSVDELMLVLFHFSPVNTMHR